MPNAPVATTISLRQFIDNPSGRGSAFLAKRATIKDGLNMTYIKLLRENRRQFAAAPYIEPNGDIIFWVKVPSELYKINHISYDVVFEFKNDQAKRLSRRDVRFFSNSPSFIFTYAYVFNKMGLLIPSLSSKLPPLCLTQAPTMRNPVESLGWEKSVYVAARYLLDGFCLTDSYIVRNGQRYDNTAEADLFRRIADPQMLMAIYRHALYMRAKTHRHQLSPAQIAARDAKAARFRNLQKQNSPKVRRGLAWITPRPKLTARKAVRSVLAKGHSPSRTIRPRPPKRSV
jgi:hypothetical protein